MRKIDHHIIEKNAVVKLYLNDIEEIIDILKEEGFENIKIETQEYEYCDNEISEIKLNQIITSIFTLNPFYIKLDFNDDYVSLYCEKNNSLANGIINKIKSLLKMKTRNLIVFTTSIWFTFLAILLINIFFDLFKPEEVSVLRNYILLQVILTLTIGAYYIFVSGKLRQNLILLEYRESKNFWQKNKDQITTSIVSGFIVSLFTIPLTIYCTLYFSSK